MSELRIVLLFALFCRLPFLFHPVQGDDLYYLYGAQHAQIDPAHPHEARYVFQGREVSMLGHPHPPLNAWLLGGLIALTGEVNELAFHSVYLLLSMLAALSVYWIARKFAEERALWATLLFLSTPAFWVSGNSFESDLPFLACALAGIALFVHGHEWWAAVPLALSGLAAYQSVALIPVLWMLRRGYVPACAPAIGVIAYQVHERVSSGVWPILATAGYFSEYGLQRFTAKLLNAASLTSHLAWTAGPIALFEPSKLLAIGLPAAAIDWNPLFWVSFAIGILVLWRVDGWLGWWVRIFFAASIVLFFAGSARYLLPLAPAVCIWAAKRLSEDRLTYAIAAQMAVAGLLTMANYQHWQAYRDFVDEAGPQMRAAIAKEHRVWIDGEWGLRFYAESLGALPMPRGQRLLPGDLVLTSEFGQKLPATGTLQKLKDADIRPALPVRLIGGQAGWSSVAFGVRPFDISTAPVDHISLYAVVERAPTESYLPMNSPAAEYQLVSGFFQLEENRYRWMGKRATALLKPASGPLTVTVFATKECEISVYAGEREMLRQKLTPGLHTLRTAPVAASSVTLEVDRVFTAPGDTRELGLIVQSVGFEK